MNTADKKMMKDIVIIGSLLLVFSGCKKIDLESMRPNNLMFGQQCMNTKDHPPSKDSPYQRLTFQDDFGSGKTGACYTMKPKCNRRLDWWMGGDCPFDEKDSRYAGLKDLNKCVWKPWEGFNYWAKNKLITFKADGVEVSGGTLKLKVMSNPDYDPSKGNCGDTNEAEPDATKYFNVNCKMISGAVDSKYLDETVKGYNALYGRIEMKARFTMTTPNAAYPALWLWPTPIGKGYPKVANGADLITHSGNGSQEPRQIGEIDILESDGGDSTDYAFQSYHQWEFGNHIHAYWTQGRTTHMADYHTYGVEWSPQSMKFYIDDCYTYEIKKGDKSTHGNRDLPMTISDTASFMMMTIGAGHKPIDLKNGDVFEIDDVRIYE